MLNVCRDAEVNEDRIAKQFFKLISLSEFPHCLFILISAFCSLGNLAPQLTINGLTPNSAGQYVINAMLNTALTFTLKATSMQNVAISYYMVGNISRESSAKLNISTGVFTWTPSSLNVVDVR